MALKTAALYAKIVFTATKILVLILY